ncbi:lebercilin-like, partial [Discoglossus pictus]
EKERELDAKNIYAYRLSKPSPKKDTEITPRRKVTNQSLSTKSVQTTESTSYVEFSPLPPPPPPPLELTSEVDWKPENTFASMEQDYREKQLRQEADKLKKEKEREDRRREQEEKQRREREQMALEDKAKKLRDEWEKEESERKIKEKLLYEDILAKEENKNNTEEEKLKKELLLAKMLEIDKEKHEVFYSDSSNPTVQSPLLDSSLKPDSAEKKHKTYKFSEPTEKLFNGLPVHDASSKTEVAARRNPKHVGSTDDFTFGSYAPSFGKGRSSSQKSEVLEEPVIISNSKLNIQKDKRSNLMEQLFGSSSNTTLPSIPNTSDSGGLFSGDTKKDHESKNILPWEKNSRGSLKNDLFFDDGRNANSNKHHSQHTPGKPVVRALDSLEDDIEEVVL